MPSPHKTRQIVLETAGGLHNINTETLAGTKNLVGSDAVYQQFDPAADRTIVLPAASASFKGQRFVISNNGSAAGEVLTVNQHADDSSTTRGTILPLHQETYISTGTAWTQELASNRSSMTNVKSSAVSFALTAADSGTIVLITANDKVVTLPSTEIGLTYTIIAGTAGGSAGLKISPAAADKIIGAGGVGADNKDAINDTGTDIIGDSLTLVGDGADGWYVVAQHGIWSQES